MVSDVGKRHGINKSIACLSVPEDRSRFVTDDRYPIISCPVPCFDRSSYLVSLDRSLFFFFARSAQPSRYLCLPFASLRRDAASPLRQLRLVSILPPLSFLKRDSLARRFFLRKRSVHDGFSQGLKASHSRHVRQSPFFGCSAPRPFALR